MDNMKIKSISIFKGIKNEGYLLSSFLIDGVLAIDSGSIGIGLNLEEQKKVKYILITHVHMDHIATLPIFLDNVIFYNSNFKIYSSKRNINYLREFVFNDTIWPDFERIGSKKNGKNNYYIDFKEVKPYLPLILEKYEITFFPSEHTVPTYGIKIINTKKKKGVIFSSDTVSLENLIREVNSDNRIKTAFVELSFPDSFKNIALDSKHLYPEKLFNSLSRIERKIDIFLIHFKKSFFKEIQEDLKKYDFKIKPKFLYPGEEIEIE